jgi:xanthine dehydrogenase YagT iron-sulfur-binding subunit
MDDISAEEKESRFDRRTFIKRATGMATVIVVPAVLRPTDPGLAEMAKEPSQATNPNLVPVSLKINGQQHALQLEARTTLLDALRDHLDLTGTKKGCDHGTCGACTVHINGERVLSCLTLAAMAQGREITTIEGMAKGGQLHPVQQAFVECDGFQCGFCTPGQIMSATSCIDENHTHSDDEIREWMSGNICRCAAYPNILDYSRSGRAGYWRG